MLLWQALKTFSCRYGCSADTGNGLNFLLFQEYWHFTSNAIDLFKTQSTIPQN
jgi:hypothetical protein